MNTILREILQQYIYYWEKETSIPLSEENRDNETNNIIPSFC